jgi:hypothetical protein
MAEHPFSAKNWTSTALKKTVAVP